MERLVTPSAVERRQVGDSWNPRIRLVEKPFRGEYSGLLLKSLVQVAITGI